MRIFLAVLLMVLVAGIMSFALMIGFTDDGYYYGIAIGTELTSSTFAYAGFSFPLELTAGGGMKLGDLYNFDFGKATNGQEIGTLNIGYGAIADAVLDLHAFRPAFFVGPGLFFKTDLLMISAKMFSYTALGARFVLNSVHPIEFSWTTGWFYVF